MTNPVESDERTVAVANASYRWGYLLLTFGILLSVAYRAFRHGEQSWDLLGLVVLGGAFTTGYQKANHILTRRSATLAVLAIVLGVAVAVMISLRSPNA